MVASPSARLRVYLATGIDLGRGRRAAAAPWRRSAISRSSKASPPLGCGPTLRPKGGLPPRSRRPARACPPQAAFREYKSVAKRPPAKLHKDTNRGRISQLFGGFFRRELPAAPEKYKKEGRAAVFRSFLPIFVLACSFSAAHDSAKERTDKPPNEESSKNPRTKNE